MWKNPSPLHQAFGFITQAFGCHQASWLWLFISLRVLPAGLGGEREVYANVRCCCLFIPGERSANNIISFNSLVNSILYSETSQAPGSTAWERACGKNHLWLSFIIRNAGRNSYMQYSFNTYIFKSSKSCAINEARTLHPHSIAIPNSWNIHPSNKQTYF